MRPTERVRRTVARLSGFALLAAKLVRHSLRAGRTGTLEQRLAMLPRHGLPLEHAALIHWNDHQVPYIEACTDRDLAVALGHVHAHLRLGCRPPRCLQHAVRHRSIALD